MWIRNSILTFLNNFLFSPMGQVRSPLILQVQWKAHKIPTGKSQEHACASIYTAQLCTSVVPRDGETQTHHSCYMPIGIAFHDHTDIYYTHSNLTSRGCSFTSEFSGPLPIALIERLRPMTSYCPNCIFQSHRRDPEHLVHCISFPLWLPKTESRQSQGKNREIGRASPPDRAGLEGESQMPKPASLSVSCLPPLMLMLTCLDTMALYWIYWTEYIFY